MISNINNTNKWKRLVNQFYNKKWIIQTMRKMKIKNMKKIKICGPTHTKTYIKDTKTFLMSKIKQLRNQNGKTRILH
jgi:hypothetical protein